MPISVLSYNVWGIFISKHLDDRMKVIAKEIAKYDIVCMQEQFEQRHADMLFDRNVFPYVERYVSCEYGSGLTIASKHPIVATMFLPFRSCGRPERVWEGDYIANKGIAAVRIAVPSHLLPDPSFETNSPSSKSSSAATAASAGSASSPSSSDTTEVVVLNTHFVAQYEKYSSIGGFFSETNAASRLTEAYQIADLACLLHGTAAKRTPIVICGDFNAGADSHEIKLLHDFCVQRGVHLKPAIQSGGGLNHSYTTENTFVGKGANEALPIQLDHIVFGDLALAQTGGSLVFTEKFKVGDEQMHLSDHFGVAATFTHIAPVEDPPEALKQAEEETIHVAGYLKSRGASYNNHFKLLCGTAVTLFGIASAGWVTKHPLLLTLAGAASMFMVFVAIGHRRHEAELYKEIGAKLTLRAPAASPASVKDLK